MRFDAASTAVFPGCHCPGHGRRVQGAVGVACYRFATLDPATAPPRSGACEEDGDGMDDLGNYPDVCPGREESTGGAAGWLLSQ
jgi:hypothetical protein